MDNDTHKGKRRPLSEVIKARREKEGMTQQKVSELTGLDQGLISRTEAGKTTPRKETIEKIAQVLGRDLIQMQEGLPSAPTNSLRLGIHRSLFSAPLFMLLKSGRVESVRFACHRAPSGEPEWDTVRRLPETGAGLPIYEEHELLEELDAGVFDMVVVSRPLCATEEGTLRCARLALHQGADILLWECSSPETPGLPSPEPRRLHDVINRTTEPLPVLYVQNSVADPEFWALSDQMRTRLRAEGVPNFSTLQRRLPDLSKALSFSYEPATSRLRSFAAQNGRICTPVAKDDECYSSPKDRLFSHDVLVSLDFVAQHLLTSFDLVNGFLEQLAKATERLNVMLSRPGPGPEIAAMANDFSLDVGETMDALQHVHPGFEFLYYPKWISHLRSA
jgi:transcriptional regulator with XRE-family HTH domain